MLSQNINRMDTATVATVATVDMSSFHKLSDKWTLWAHLPHNTDWSMNSYIPISTVATIEETIAVTETLPPKLIENCMLFLMRHNIKPTWEDPLNRHGGCFSYKVTNKSVVKAWTDLSYAIVGNSISASSSFVNCVMGITISPKKNFCIIKIWMTNCDHQNPAAIIQINGLQSQGCLFKKHTPEY